MMKLVSILICGVLLVVGSPISELNVGVPPTAEEVRNLNHPGKKYEVFLNSENKVEYRSYEYRRVKGVELPFKIVPKAVDEYDFGGRQVNLKVDNGWLVGFDKGEWGGNLFWFNEKGTKYEKITSGNIKNLFKINGKIYATEGLAHLYLSSGQIFAVELVYGKWTVEKKIDLPNTPYATTLTKDKEFLIGLYPNSILIDKQTIYIGMRAGILRTQFGSIDKQEWLTEK